MLRCLLIKTNHWAVPVPYIVEKRILVAFVPNVRVNVVLAHQIGHETLTKLIARNTCKHVGNISDLLRRAIPDWPIVKRYSSLSSLSERTDPGDATQLCQSIKHELNRVPRFFYGTLLP